MIFKVESKSLSVYDPKSQAFIAEFVGGIFETNNEVVINRLKELGYNPLEVVSEVEETVIKDATAETQVEVKKEEEIIPVVQPTVITVEKPKRKKGEPKDSKKIPQGN